VPFQEVFDYARRDLRGILGSRDAPNNGFGDVSILESPQLGEISPQLPERSSVFSLFRWRTDVKNPRRMGRVKDETDGQGIGRAGSDDQQLDPIGETASQQLVDGR
jgi:hypothetical protein